jgi:hypothetical protein
MSHSLVAVIIPFDSHRENIATPVARAAAAYARIDTLLFRYEQPQQQSWGVDFARGYRFDGWEIGGQWEGWGHQVRRRLKSQGLHPLKSSIPRSIKPNAVWSEDLAHVMLTSFPLFPVAIITPYGEWEECPGSWGWGKSTKRERKLESTWLRRMRKLLRAGSGCLAVGVDCHS